MACIDCTCIQNSARKFNLSTFGLMMLLSNSVCLSCHRVKTNTTLGYNKHRESSLYRSACIQHGSWAVLRKGTVAIILQCLIDLVHVVHDERTIMGNRLSMGG